MFDIFIKRPVLATVVSLLILILGLKALTGLQVRQYPEMTNTVISVTTTYPGADAELMQGFITQPIQKAVATASGIDYLTSSSSAGRSEIKVYIRLNEDSDAAMTEVMAKVAETKSVLPRGINDPVIVKTTGQGFADMYLAFSSKTMSPEQITDYVSRVIQPKLSIIPGVANPELLGGQKFSMRVWLDPDKLAQRNLTAEDVRQALTDNNVQSAAGSAKGYFDLTPTTARTDLRDVEGFRQMVVAGQGTNLVRLGDIATVELGPEQNNEAVYAHGDQAVFIGVHASPDANVLTTISAVHEALPALERAMPAELKLIVAYDSTVFIRAAIEEVVITLLEASVIVMIVIFFFMGSFRSVAIPVVTVPLSLVGVGLALMALGFSINLLTLLAMVLAIGLVVDDAIVVVENVHRHIEEGKTPFQAAIIGTREIANPVISMTITLAAVYAPIAFMGGLTGSLFQEFALTLAGAVIVSGVIALTLSPMMSSKILKHDDDKTGLPARIDRTFDRVRDTYARWLSANLDARGPVVLFAAIVSVSLIFLFQAVPSELAPEEDQGVMFSQFTGPANANIDFMATYTSEVGRTFSSFPETSGSFLIAGMGGSNQGFGGAILKSWDERDRGPKAMIPELQQKLNQIPGVKASAFVMPALPGADGLPVQYVINTTSDYRMLAELSQTFTQKAMQTGLFMFSDTDLKFQSPRTVVDIDRDKAATYGVTMDQIGTALATMTGGNYVNMINLQGRSYQVIPQVPREFRLDPDKLGRFYVKASSGERVPLSNLVALKSDVQPVSLNQFNQANSVTFSAVQMPGVSLGTALAALDKIAAEELPKGMLTDTSGPSRQFMQEGNALVQTFVFALVIIFLVLAAQFESFRDPLVILVSVPLSLCGALIPLALGISSMNIYSQVGLVTLIGLITKHGILICEVAREAQEEHGWDRRRAVEHAAALRLRPILMTTAAMVAGLVPLMFASGAGAASRFSIAVVIVAGMSIGTLFTLFVLPVIYTFLATDRRGRADHSRELSEIDELPATAKAAE